MAYVAGILLHDMRTGSLFHNLPRGTHLEKWRVRYIGAAELLAASEAIDESDMLSGTM